MSGRPSFVELGVPDVARARAFYGGLLDWELGDPDGPTHVRTGTLDVGIHGDDPSAILEVFFDVDDLDLALDRLARLGGALHGTVHDSRGFGRWAECVDDQGVRFGLRQPA